MYGGTSHHKRGTQLPHTHLRGTGNENDNISTKTSTKPTQSAPKTTIQPKENRKMALLDLQHSLFFILVSFCSLPALYILYATFRAVSSPLGGIPGPFLARFTRFWELREIYKGEFEKTNIKLHKKYGNSSPLSYSLFLILRNRTNRANCSK